MDARRTVLVLYLLLLAAGVSATAAASGAASVILTAASTLSMDQAVKMIEQRFHARVVKAEAQHDAGRTVYVLRLLNDSGKVWTVRVDASSGALL
jgi:uncharacterized membrane protein YkoI